MVEAVWFVPLVVVLVTAGLWFADKLGGRPGRVVSRLGTVFFGRFVGDNVERRRVLEAAYSETTYRSYAAKTYLFAVLGLIGGAVAGAYLVAGVLAVFESIVRTMAQLPRTMTRPLGITPRFELILSDSSWWLVVLLGGLAIGVVVGLSAYVLRWQLPKSTAEVRRRGIEEGLPRTVAFMYALSRGGMSVPAQLRVLGDHRSVYGETANEVSIATREMDLFGRDIISAVRRMARRTPSDQFKTFSENLASVLQSGSSLSAFLREQYDRFQEEAEERQDEVIDLLATIAEGYVTVLVAGTLFLITILLVFGLTTTDTLWLLQLLAYLLIPLANAGFVVFLAQQLDALGIGYSTGAATLGDVMPQTPTRPRLETDPVQADGGRTGDATLRRQLARYDTVSRVKGVVRQPFRTVFWHPEALLYVTVPLAVAVLLIRSPAALQAEGINIRILDDLIVQSLLFVLVTYAVVRWLYKRRIMRMEAAIPEMLERLASLNEAGMSVVEGFNRVRGSDLGVLTPEVERIWRDMTYGANIGDALVRFGRRIRTTAVTRVVTLLTNAVRASGQMGQVLRIASEQARADLRLRRQRRRQMLTYLIVIYVAFVVFLVIIVAVNQVLVPSLPQSVPTPDAEEINRLGVNIDQFARIGQADKPAYMLIFFHTALIQAVCSGFVGGQLGEGSLKDGAKHAAAMLAIAYVVFVLITSPVASITLADDHSTGQDIALDSVTLSDGGYVAVHRETVNGTMIGSSEYLAAGTHSNVTIQLTRPVDRGEPVAIVPYHDTNGNRVFDYTGPPWIPGEHQVDRPYDPLSNDAKPGITVEVELAD